MTGRAPALARVAHCLLLLRNYKPEHFAGFDRDRRMSGLGIAAGHGDLEMSVFDPAPDDFIEFREDNLDSIGGVASVSLCCVVPEHG